MKIKKILSFLFLCSLCYSSIELCTQESFAQAYQSMGTASPYGYPQPSPQMPPMQYAQTMPMDMNSMNGMNNMPMNGQVNMPMDMNAMNSMGGMVQTQQQMPIEPPSVMEQALSLHQAGRYADAVHLYESIIFATPPDPRVYASIADAHFRLGNYERALKYVVESLKLDTNYSSGHLLLGSILAELGDYARAIRSYKRVLVLDQNNPYAYYNLGLLHYKKEDVRNAIEYLEKARELNPNDPKIWNNLGVAYYDQSLFPQAMICYSEALRLDPNYESAARNMILLQQSIPPAPPVVVQASPEKKPAKKKIYRNTVKKKSSTESQKESQKKDPEKENKKSENNTGNSESFAGTKSVMDGSTQTPLPPAPIN